MKTVQIICLIILVLCAYSLQAQVTDKKIEALFSSSDKTEHVSSFPGYSNKVSNYYWIEHDTLFSCLNIMGKKIALSDIDFSQKKISKTARVDENTKANIYVLSITPIKGKPVIKTSCLNDRILGSLGNSTDATIDLDLPDNPTAERAYTYLQKTTHAGKSSILLSKKNQKEDKKPGNNDDEDLEDKLNKLASEADAEKEQLNKATKPDTTNSKSESISQLLDRIKKESGDQPPVTSETDREFDRLVAEEEKKRAAAGSASSNKTNTLPPAQKTVSNPVLKRKYEKADDVWALYESYNERMKKLNSSTDFLWLRFKGATNNNVLSLKTELDRAASYESTQLYNYLNKIRIIDLSPGHNVLLDAFQTFLNDRLAFTKEISTFMTYLNSSNQKTKDSYIGYMRSVEMKNLKVNNSQSDLNNAVSYYKSSLEKKTSADQIAGTVDGAGDFESQLLQLINGLADNYTSLKGSVVKGNQYLSKVQLSGSVSTKIITGMMGITSLFAEFGDFNTEQEANQKYNEITVKINQCTKLLNHLVQQTEFVSPNSKTNSWLPFGNNGKIDPAIKQFSLILEMVKSLKFDKDYNKSDYYYVQLKIAK